MKRCSKCEEQKSITDFYTTRGKAVSRCKSCDKGSCLTRIGTELAKARSDEYQAKDGRKKCAVCEARKDVQDFYMMKYKGALRPLRQVQAVHHTASDDMDESPPRGLNCCTDEIQGQECSQAQ